MASRLFQTIVGVGIALSAASMGCADPGEEASSKGESAINSETSSTTPAAPAADAAAPDAGPNWDAFCDATWPTTKGGVLFPGCVDPQNECDRSTAFDCAVPSDTGPGVCKADWLSQTLAVCVGGTWTCKPGKVKSSTCTCFEWEGGTTCPAADGGTAQAAE
jgi:hypothetical protein